MAIGEPISQAVMGGANMLMGLISGAKQLKEGKDIKKKLEAQGRPLYDMPKAFKESEGLTRSQYLDPRMRMQTRMEEQAKAGAANQIRNITEAAGSGSQALQALGIANKNLQTGITQIGLNAAQQKYRDFANMINTLGQKAGYQDQMWSYNIRQPYDELKAKSEALQQAGMQNLSNAFKTGGSTALGVSGAITGKDNTDLQQQYYRALIASLGGNKNITATTAATGGMATGGRPQ